MKMLWRPSSNNEKTGNIPQGYVGETREDVETSCAGCPMRKNGCYHWGGRPIAAQSSMQKRYLKLAKEYSLTFALAKSRRTAQYVRGAVGGDPWVFGRAVVKGWIDDIKDAGLKGLLLYTHFAADKGAHLKGLALASVHSLEEADDRIREGWRTALVVDFKVPGSKRASLRKTPTYNGEVFISPDGHRATVCPAQTKRGVTCNSCGLCEATTVTQPIIVFLKH